MHLLKLHHIALPEEDKRPPPRPPRHPRRSTPRRVRKAGRQPPGQDLSHPTGTVTFLFTDIEGSTKRWETYPEAMSTALQRHDAILRSAIEGCGGYIFKTVGDAFCAAFATAPEALGAAVSAQRALAREQWSQ